MIGYVTPYTKMFGLLEPFGTMEMISKAGFNGVEVLLSGDARKNPGKYSQAAKRYGLSMNGHILWSKENSPHTLHSYPLSWFGYLLPDSYTFQEAVPSHTHFYCEGIVVNGEYWRESSFGSPYWLQTYGQVGSDGKFMISYPQFVSEVRKKQLPVVFDTEHCLEFMLDVHGPGKLPTNKGELLAMLKGAWEALWPYVQEIHFNDCNPSRGITKVFPGEGQLPLKEFAQYIRASGWGKNESKKVSLEMMPAHSKGGKRLREALAVARNMLEG